MLKITYHTLKYLRIVPYNPLLLFLYSAIHAQAFDHYVPPQNTFTHGRLITMIHKR